MPRNSIMSGFGGTEKIKDARPLHDKSFVQQCIRQLHEVKTLYLPRSGCIQNATVADHNIHLNSLNC